MKREQPPQTAIENDEVEYVGRIRSQYASLSKGQKRIANYILNHREEVTHYSITTLAQKTNTAPSTVTRFCQGLSYEGFSELKVYISKSLLAPSIFDAPIRPEDELQVVMQKLMNSSQRAVTDTLRTLDAKMVEKAVDAILAAHTVTFFGQSGGYVSALYGQQMLLRVSVISSVMRDNTDADIAASNLGEGDVAIGINYSGENKPVVQALSMARRNGARTIAITATPYSSLDRLVHYTLFYCHDIPDDIQYLHLGSMCEIAILGVIQAEILRRPQQQKKIEASKKAVLRSRLK